MGSLRTPVGPLPSSIYWRRRAVVLLVIALVAVLAFWATRPGGGGSQNTAGSDDGSGPAPSITPGPSASESLIDERPGGREEPGEGEAGDGGSGDAEDPGADGGSDETEDADGDGEPGAPGDADGDGGSGGADADPDRGGGGTSGAGLPACGTGAVTLALRSAENAYPPGDKPELRLTAQNASGDSCALDFGHGSLTLTIADSDDEEVWSSAVCPTGRASHLVAVPAGDSAAHTVLWDRRHNADDCDSGEPGAPAAAGTYIAEADLDGFPVARTSFRLNQD
ncbi:hypothetical protein N0X72_12795 [Streptomyces carpaticus]|uniref:hypothetical protein n=1 Tax=Streptomyces TaxID=1883 RepID=UPI000474AF57|nr:MULTISPECIES: hypothetical protein [Streptomyces]QKV69424.1 hypothetical protein HUT13_11990 [Streptomyces harbinensis]UWM49818.1 hypothetical protein N0X72_12795 [Streptomyces carpaticus]